MLVAREAGLEVPVGEDLHASLREIEYLQTSIGWTGLLALKPLQMALAPRSLAPLRADRRTTVNGP